MERRYLFQQMMLEHDKKKINKRNPNTVLISSTKLTQDGPRTKT